MKIVKICPICGEDNKCKSGTKDGSLCWCFNKKIPEGLLNMIPEEKRGQACVCEKCVDKYNLEVENKK